MDLTKIPVFHRRVVKVDLLSGKAVREPGVSYKCHLSAWLAVGKLVSTDDDSDQACDLRDGSGERSLLGSETVIER
jgi:hypothetical protein